MTPRNGCYAAATAAVLLCGATLPVVAQQFDAKVIGVADGDTLTVLHVDSERGTMTPTRVRVSGIDAPEKAQPFGQVARAQLAALSFGRMGRLDCRVTDRYRRKVCVVRVDGVDVGLRMIESGLAWHFVRYSSTQPPAEAASYSLAENKARAERVGLWRDLGAQIEPVPPWEWRKK